MLFKPTTFTTILFFRRTAQPSCRRGPPRGFPRLATRPVVVSSFCAPTSHLAIVLIHPVQLYSPECHLVIVLAAAKIARSRGCQRALPLRFHDRASRSLRQAGGCSCYISSALDLLAFMVTIFALSQSRCGRCTSEQLPATIAVCACLLSSSVVGPLPTVAALVFLHLCCFPPRNIFRPDIHTSTSYRRDRLTSPRGSLVCFSGNAEVFNSSDLACDMREKSVPSTRESFVACADHGRNLLGMELCLLPCMHCTWVIGSGTRTHLELQHFAQWTSTPQGNDLLAGRVFSTPPSQGCTHTSVSCQRCATGNTT